MFIGEVACDVKAGERFSVQPQTLYRIQCLWYNVQRAQLLKRRRSNVNFSASRVIVLPEYRFTLAVCVAFWE